MQYENPTPLIIAGRKWKKKRIKKDIQKERREQDKEVKNDEAKHAIRKHTFINQSWEIINKNK